MRAVLSTRGGIVDSRPFHVDPTYPLTRETRVLED